MEEDIKIIINQILEFNQTKEYANEFQIRFYQAIENLLKAYKEKEENKCLHCGKNIAGYCEECYQELIGENAKLQLELTDYRESY